MMRTRMASLSAPPLGSQPRLALRAGGMRSRRAVLSARQLRLLSLCRRIAFGHPVGSEVFLDVQHFHVRKTQRAKRLIGRLHVRAVIPRTAAAVNHNEFAARERGHPSAQLLHTLVLGRGTDIFRSGDVRCLVKETDADLEDERLLAAARFEDAGEFLRLDDGGLGDRRFRTFRLGLRRRMPGGRGFASEVSAGGDADQDGQGERESKRGGIECVFHGYPQIYPHGARRSKPLLSNSGCSRLYSSMTT